MQPTHINNGETGLSVRTKLNNIIKEMIESGEGINSLWEAVSELRNDVNAVSGKAEGNESLIGDSVLSCNRYTDGKVNEVRKYVDGSLNASVSLADSVSYTPDVPVEKPAIVYTTVSGTFAKMRDSSGQAITVPDTCHMGIFFKEAHKSYWTFRDVVSFEDDTVTSSTGAQANAGWAAAGGYLWTDIGVSCAIPSEGNNTGESPEKRFTIITGLSDNIPNFTKEPLNNYFSLTINNTELGDTLYLAIDEDTEIVGGVISGRMYMGLRTVIVFNNICGHGLNLDVESNGVPGNTVYIPEGQSVVDFIYDGMNDFVLVSVRDSDGANRDFTPQCVRMTSTVGLGIDEGGMPEPRVHTKFKGMEFILWHHVRNRKTLWLNHQSPFPEIQDRQNGAFPSMQRVFYAVNRQFRPVVFVVDDAGYLTLKDNCVIGDIDISAGCTLGNFLWNAGYIRVSTEPATGKLMDVQWKGQYKCKVMHDSFLSNFHKSALFAISPADRKGLLTYIRYYLTIGTSTNFRGGFVSYFNGNSGKFVRVKATTSVAWR